MSITATTKSKFFLWCFPMYESSSHVPIARIDSLNHGSSLSFKILLWQHWACKKMVTSWKILFPIEVAANNSLLSIMQGRFYLKSEYPGRNKYKFPLLPLSTLIEWPCACFQGKICLVVVARGYTVTNFLCSRISFHLAHLSKQADGKRLFIL